ncbi:cytochrome c biogenesis protein CcdA [Paenibacillus melissococcoides]|uniref:Cytochrome c biogenesis protein CcdA n=1 Tax=Paenibacillus melissococcoides TaxID=2912268 RepID=A0ABM9FWB5_9BACL|nr:cytochrome c biogenesis protein CcdA [Paenibacillus melissococcoides]CAH8243452.1 cytochrome c biogenesis protein CcdA [Paenibacillus melissococcoides]CAH8704557.1 cytochrome c biogenesis protein CcdA [Paenibacillus melissococcoides]CAH8707827.1 cytochrome c biogenesis protein CcdA [Paenibacillus melissococcoides]
MPIEQLVWGSVFVAGLLSFFSPCILPLMPVYISILSTNNQEPVEHKKLLGKIMINPHLIVKTIIFIIGLSTSFVLLGFGAGILGSVINTQWFIVICGSIVILLGLHQVGLFPITFLNREKKLHTGRSGKGDLIGTYLLGFTFSIGWTPCIGPILGAVLGLSASEGQATYGAFLMFLYALGLLIPFLIIAFFSDIVLRRLKKINRHLEKLKIAGGVIIIIMGLFLMTNNLNWFTTLISQ